MAFSIGVGIAAFERYWSNSNCSTRSAWEASVTDEGGINSETCARSFGEEEEGESVCLREFSTEKTH